MITRVALGLVAAAALSGSAAADPIVAKDALGQTYQLNDDGTYGIIVKTDDGKTLLIDGNGAWSSPDEKADLDKKFLGFLDQAMAQPNGPKIDPAVLPAYRTCILGVFDGFPVAARRMLVSGPNIQNNFERVQKAFPDVAKALNDSDQGCKKSG
jgi:hypothetical protein